MDKGNTRNSDPNDIADELHRISFHNESEAQAHVYFNIMDSPKQDAETVFGTPEAELREELENSETIFEKAEKTIEISRSDKMPPSKKEKALADDGLLGEDEAEAYVHYGRLDDSNLVEELGKPVSRIEQEKERAEKIIEKAYELTEFRGEYKGFQVA